MSALSNKNQLPPAIAASFPLISQHHAFLDTAEAALYLRLSRSCLAKWRCAGGGPGYILVGRKVVYAVSDLEAWLASRRRRSTSETVK